MRLYGISPADVELAIGCRLWTDIDEQGNSRVAGLDSRGRAIIVVVAADNSSFVITTFPDD